MDSIKGFLAEADLVPMLSDWAVKIVLALLLYIVGQWVVKRITN